MFNSADINKIKNTNSRKNFELVLQSYYSLNYKASVLLLYNLTVNDLYEKLQVMNEKNYINCKIEIEEIEKIINENNESKYSIVEEKIFKVYNEKKILNHSTLDLLMYFKKIRNKCAHPFFFKEQEYSPIQEEVYLFIIKIYNEILVVDAFFKEPYEVMKKDIKNLKNLDITLIVTNSRNMEDDIKFVRNVFELKYFKFLTDNNFKKLFKSLMDLTICKRNDDIQKEQYQHFAVLYSMLEFLNNHNKIGILNDTFRWSRLKEDIIEDSFEIFEEWLALTFLYKVLSCNKVFLKELEDSNELVYNKIKEKLYKNGYLFVNYWDLFDYDINVSLSKLHKSVMAQEYSFILKNMYRILNSDIMMKSVIMMLEKIPSNNGYNIADDCIDTLLDILENSSCKYSMEELKNVFQIMNNNRQIYARTRGKRDYQIKKIEELGYDLNNYENLLI